MTVADVTVLIRLLAPVLLSFITWVVWRAPYRQRANRILAVFLGVVAAGFWVEFLWDATRGLVPDAALAFRLAQNALGFLDPPLLVLFAVVWTYGDDARLPTWAWATYAATGTALWLLPVGASGVGTDLLRLGSLLYVNGSYLLGFGVLVHAYRFERRAFMGRQLRALVIGVGFAAFSRSNAFFLAVGPSWSQMPNQAAQMTAGSVLTLVVLLAFVGAYAVRARLVGTEGRPVWRLFALLTLVVFGFYLAWYATIVAVSGTAWQEVESHYFGMRWIVVAAVVAYGILRYQLFDFDLRARQVVALAVTTILAIGVGMAIGVAAGERGMGVLAMRAVAVAVALAFSLPVFVILNRLGRLLESDERRARREEQRRLEIYQATLEMALEKPTWSEAERRFVDTLREVFEVSPEEHERVVAALRSQDGPAPGRTGAGARESARSRGAA